MLYGVPAKLPDGRYFLKVAQEDGTHALHQVNDVEMSIGEPNQVTLKIPAAVTLFSEIDEQIITQAKESKLLWFGKEISDDTVLSAYQKSLTPEYELAGSLATIKGSVVTTFYSQKVQVDASHVTPETPVDVLLELSGLVFTKRVFEPVWKVVQVRIKTAQRPKFPREYLFKDDPADEEEEEVDL